MQLALWVWIEMWLVWGFAQWASEQEKLPAQQGNLLVSDCWTEVFSSPEDKMLSLKYIHNIKSAVVVGWCKKR